MIEARARNQPGYRANEIVEHLLASDGFEKWAGELPPGYWWEVGGEKFESLQSKKELKI